MIMVSGDINIMDGIEELIEDLNLTVGLGTLIKLDEYRPCIAHLVQLQVFPKLYGNSRIAFSKEFNPNGGIDEDFIGHGDSSPRCFRFEVCLHVQEFFLSS